MRRREVQGTPPPAELLTYDEDVWLPQVDPAGYRADSYRNRTAGEPTGLIGYSFDAWRRDQAAGLWLRARLDWCAEHGWPGGWDRVDLLREFAQQMRHPNPALMRRRSALRRPW